MAYDHEVMREWIEIKVNTKAFREITNDIFGDALLIPNAAVGGYTAQGNVKEIKARMLARTQKLVEMINAIPEE
jgi:hypothetical protein